MKQIKKIIEIDRDTCIGCGQCAQICHQSAIAMVGGKAMVVGESRCDGLGNCLPACPVDAIHFVQKEVETFSCPGAQAQDLAPKLPEEDNPTALSHWPVQIKLAPITAPYFDGANLLISADCAAYAYGNFHRDFMADHITLIGCPKLDAGDYTEKLTQILAQNDVKSVAVARMEVPCCGGLERAVSQAAAQCGKALSITVTTFTLQGRIRRN